MKRLLYSVAMIFLLGLPVQAGADYWAGATVTLQLSGPYTQQIQYYGGREWQSAFARSPLSGLAENTFMDHPTNLDPGCVAGDIACYNRYAAGYSEADLSRGVLKAFAASRVLGTFPEDPPPNPALLPPNNAVAIADLMDTLTVTIPAGIGETYYLGVTYNIDGTMSGSYHDQNNRGLASVGLLGSLRAPGFGGDEGISAGLNWIKETTDSTSLTYSDAGEFGINLEGQAEATTVSVLLRLSLYSEAYVWGLGDDRAVSNFGSTAHAALTYDPRLTVTGEGPFPGIVGAVPEPSILLLIGIGLTGVAAAKRKGRK